MRNRTMIAAALVAAVASLSACGERGDGLADGAVDRPRDGNEADAAQDVGPPSAPVQSASPALGNSASQPGATAAGSSTSATLTLVSQGPKGPYVGDGTGATLYYLEGDRDGSKCVGSCLVAWPAVAMGATQPNGGPGLQGAMIATISRPDGSRQVTYAGHPLYRYAADAGAGSTKGDGVTDRFGTWRIVRPTGDADAGGQAPAAGPDAAAPGTDSAAAQAASKPATGGTR